MPTATETQKKSFRFLHGFVARKTLFFSFFVVVVRAPVLAPLLCTRVFFVEVVRTKGRMSTTSARPGTWRPLSLPLQNRGPGAGVAFDSRSVDLVFLRLRDVTGSAHGLNCFTHPWACESNAAAPRLGTGFAHPAGRQPMGAARAAVASGRLWRV